MAKSVSSFFISKEKNPTPERLYYEKMVELFRGRSSAIARFARVRNAYVAMKPYADHDRSLRYIIAKPVLEYFHDRFLMDIMKGAPLNGESKEERVYNAGNVDFYRAFYSLKCAVGTDVTPISGCYARCKRLVEEIIDLDVARGLDTVKKDQQNIDKMLFTLTLRTIPWKGKEIPAYELLRSHISGRFWLKENREKTLLKLCSEAWDDICAEYPRTIRRVPITGDKINDIPAEIPDYLRKGDMPIR